MWPKLFFQKERIVRHIYTDDHYNPNTKRLKANFFGFSLQEKGSGKYELSCNRFEMETIPHCHNLGEVNISGKKVYFGFACTTVSTILSHANYSLAHTPMYNKGVYNYSHTDIYDNDLPGVPKHELGEVLTSKTRMEREAFIAKWKVYSKEDNLSKSDILP